MARIAGVDIPDKKRGEIALTYIFGIGRSRAKKILTDAGISVDKKASEWSDDEASAVRNAISNEYKVEGALRSEVQLSIKRLMDIGCYRGTGSHYGRTRQRRCSWQLLFRPAVGRLSSPC